MAGAGAGAGWSRRSRSAGREPDGGDVVVAALGPQVEVDAGDGAEEAGSDGTEVESGTVGHLWRRRPMRMEAS